jgi:cytochrome c oxidase assembly protein subunit 15
MCCGELYYNDVQSFPTHKSGDSPVPLPLPAWYLATMSARIDTLTAPSALRIPHNRTWNAEIADAHRGALAVWFWSIAALTFGVMVVGGITRLTLSGLSIVDWNPLFGIIPPLTDAQWQQTFSLYQQFPDYAWRTSMTLEQFKFIFFWEYLHRLLARSIGLVFLVPFAFFAWQRYFTRQLLWRALLLFALGAMQGVMGWLMVKSGLVDRPSVSHFRLAAHLSLAFLIVGWAVWLARSVALRNRATLSDPERTALLYWLRATGIVLAAQIVWGAFVAGLRAGKYYPTFPRMGESLVPRELLQLDPIAHNFIANPIAVQWTHRVLGTLVALVVIGAAAVTWRRVRERTSRAYAGATLTLVVAQYALGVATLLLLVPVSIGVAHQALAMVLFCVWLCWLHHVQHTFQNVNIRSL